MLRRKAAAALSVLRDGTTQAPLAPPPTHLFAALGRSTTAPAPGNRLRNSASTSALGESIAFGRRAPLPPSPAMTSSLKFGRPSTAFMALPSTTSALAGLSMSGQLRGQSGTPLARPSRSAWGDRSQAHLPSVPGAPPSRGKGLGSAAALGSTRTIGTPHAATPAAHLGGDPSGHHAAPLKDPLGGREGDENMGALADEVDDLAERLAQVERVTSMLTPEYTNALQRKLQASFSTIGDRMNEVDGVLLTEAQKRRVAAALHIQAVARGFIKRLGYRAALSAIRAWRSRELAEMGAPVVAWLRKREGVNEQIDDLQRTWHRRIKVHVFSEWLEQTRDGLPVKFTACPSPPALPLGHSFTTCPPSRPLAHPLPKPWPPSAQVRHSLDDELKARRHYRRRLCFKMIVGWKRVAHHASLAEVRWAHRVASPSLHTTPC